MQFGGRLWIWAGVGTVALGAVLWVLFVDGEAETGDGVEPTRGAPVEATGPERSGGGGEPDSAARSGPGSERREQAPTAAERRRQAERVALRRARRVYRAYVDAINARDGAAICARIEPGFLTRLRPPVERGPCAQRIGGSIGHADERGYPVWEETVLSGVESSRLLGGERVQLTASIVTRFADRDEPSVESDVAYLVPDGDGSYRLAQPTGALWRALGKPDVPPQAIAPPPGF